MPDSIVAHLIAGWEAICNAPKSSDKCHIKLITFSLQKTLTFILVFHEFVLDRVYNITTRTTRCTKNKHVDEKDKTSCPLLFLENSYGIRRASTFYDDETREGEAR